MKAVMVLVLVAGVSACGVNPVDEDPAGADPAMAHPGVGNPVELSSSGLGAHDWLIEGLVPAGLARHGAPVAGAADAAGDAAALPVATASAPPATTCVVVAYCDAPGPDGTRCVQNPSCDLNDAAEQCASEAPRECLRVVCPWVLVGHNGRRLVNGACL